MPEILELNKRKIKKISVVCPYYNEQSIIEHTVKKFINLLSNLKYPWELILVNDGSKDESFNVVRNIVKDRDNIVLVTYPYNHGRGYALKKGIEKATGDIIVTTEIDLSWGEDIVYKIVNKFEQEPYLDCVVASPNLRGGGYKNVPFRRILLSKIGNFLIRLFFVPGISMNTGMTRGYRREVILGVQIRERGKEFHLEVLLKLYTLNYRIGEIPANLEWKKYIDKSGNKEIKRKSSSHTKKLLRTHLKFMFLARPIKYFWAISLFMMTTSFLFFCYGIYRLLIKEVSIYMALVSLLLAIFSLLFLGFGVIADQNVNILKELWREETKID